MDPVEKLQEVFKIVSSLHQLFSNSPIFGVEFSVEEKPPSLDALKITPKNDGNDVIEEEPSDAFAAYYADGNKNVDREPVFDKDIGLAIEKLRDGVTMSSLWNC
eukprot:GEZU01008838.1.p1 GENE.GEZU01008838.1~~GEZU01008838.1.p1  ORF type:complete len:104 (-),score=36.61 GEZU01008838.1:106-417(-)